MSRRQIIFAIAFVALTGALAFILWPRQTKQPLVHVKIVRQGEEQGKPVVFFKVEVAGHRRIQINNVERAAWDRREKAISWGPGPVVERNDFWPPSQGSFLRNWPQRQGFKEIGVLAPTNVSVWKVRVQLGVEGLSPLKRLRRMASNWNFLRGQKDSLLVATERTWHGIYYIAEQEIESDWITNAVSEP